MKWKRAIHSGAAAKYPDPEEVFENRAHNKRLKNKRVMTVRLKDGTTFFQTKQLDREHNYVLIHRFRISKETFLAMQEGFNIMNRFEYEFNANKEPQGSGKDDV